MALGDVDLGLLARTNNWTGGQTFNGVTTFNRSVYFGRTVQTATVTLGSSVTTMQDCDATTASFTITLTSTGNPGQILIITKVDATANVVTVNPGTSIGGYTGSVQLQRQNDSVMVQTTTVAGVYRIVGGSFNPVRPAPEILMTSGTPQAGDTISGTTTETAFATQVLIRANTVVPKTMIKVEGYGSYGTTTAATQQPQVRLGPLATAATARTVIANGGALTTLLAATAGALYNFDLTIQVRSIGTSGVIACVAKLLFVSMASGQATAFEASTAPAVFSTAVFNSTVDNYVTLTDTMSSAATGNTNTLQMMQGVQYMPSAAS